MNENEKDEIEENIEFIIKHKEDFKKALSCHRSKWVDFKFKVDKEKKWFEKEEKKLLAIIEVINAHEEGEECDHVKSEVEE